MTAPSPAVVPDLRLDPAADGLRALLEQLPDAVLVVDREGAVVQANAEAERMFGYGPGELAGLSVERLVPERLAARHVAHRAAFMAAPRARPMGAGLELAGRRRDGQEVPVTISLGPLEWSGRPAVLCVVRDVTERQAIEAERRRFLASAERRSAQLLALHDAGLMLTANLSLATVLEQAVSMARDLIGARYGALAVFDADDVIARFLTSGLSESARSALGDPPKGRGLLGAVLAEGRPVRSGDIGADPRGSGFPAGHPAMSTFLGVPIRSGDRIVGTLYLTDKLDGEAVLPFDDEDETFLDLIADQIGVAAENARLHALARSMATVAERERIARELHDSLAQVLGYVRLQASLSGTALDAGDLDAARAAMAQIDQVAMEAYADVREAILGLRSHPGTERDLAGSLRRYAEQFQLQSGLPVQLDLAPEPAGLQLAPMAEAQLLRIIQEALSNARKHAACSEVRVRLAYVPAGEALGLAATIEDDGRGFDASRPPGGLHFGLASMRERAEEAGGRLVLDTAPGRGTRVIAWLPLVQVSRAGAGAAG